MHRTTCIVYGLTFVVAWCTNRYAKADPPFIDVRTGIKGIRFGCPRYTDMGNTIVTCHYALLLSVAFIVIPVHFEQVSTEMAEAKENSDVTRTGTNILHLPGSMHVHLSSIAYCHHPVLCELSTKSYIVAIYSASSTEGVFVGLGNQPDVNEMEAWMRIFEENCVHDFEKQVNYTCGWKHSTCCHS